MLKSILIHFCHAFYKSLFAQFLVCCGSIFKQGQVCCGGIFKQGQVCCVGTFKQGQVCCSGIFKQGQVSVVVFLNISLLSTAAVLVERGEGLKLYLCFFFS